MNSVLMIIKSKPISKGKGKGKLLISNKPLSFLGGVDPKTGEVVDRNHDLNGENIKDRVLFIPGGKGSTVGSYVIFQLKKNSVAPKAIICINAEPIIATGAIMSNIPMVDRPESVDKLLDSLEVEVDGSIGEIEVFL
jgi:predicted aconitase with swiveling domain